MTVSANIYFCGRGQRGDRSGAIIKTMLRRSSGRSGIIVGRDSVIIN